MVREGKALLQLREGVFYNPYMVVNRDLSLLVMLLLGDDIVVCDAMGASGVRSIRALLELPNVAKVLYNDADPSAIENFRQNAQLNQIDMSRVEIHCKDASLLLREIRNCHYVDIDPYGSPIPFLESSLFPVRRGGVLAVTATDTSVLSGTYPHTCLRRYASRPLLKAEFYHEVGLRILIKKVVEEGAKHDYAFSPIFSYSYRHHMRVFFKKDIGAKRTDQVVQQLGYILYCENCLYREGSFLENIRKVCPVCGSKLLWSGPLWLGPLWNRDLVEDMWKNRGAILISEETNRLLKRIREEANHQSIGFYTMSSIGRALKVSNLPPMVKFLRKLEGVRTHISHEGFRTLLPHVEVLKRIHELLR